MHKNHLIGCGIGILLALVVVALSGGNAGSLGVLAAVLVCPVVMLGAMWFLASSFQSGPSHGTDADAESTEAVG